MRDLTRMNVSCSLSCITIIVCFGFFGYFLLVGRFIFSLKFYTLEFLKSGKIGLKKGEIIKNKISLGSSIFEDTNTLTNPSLFPTHSVELISDKEDGWVISSCVSRYFTNVPSGQRRWIWPFSMSLTIMLERESHTTSEIKHLFTSLWPL